MNLKKIIAKQKAASRRAIALNKIYKDKISAPAVLNERAFLDYDFNNVKTIDELMSIIHMVKHFKISKAQKYTRCKLCKKIALEIQQDIQDILPKMGNLLAVLEKEVADERAKVESRKLPSQNDITRWALKDAVLAYYQGLNYPSDKPVIENRLDIRLVDDLAPDFDVIAKIWLTKLDELKRRNDKYTLNEAEFDKAQADLSEKMQGSAFEKALDRYRIEFMDKLPR